MTSDTGSDKAHLKRLEDILLSPTSPDQKDQAFTTALLQSHIDLTSQRWWAAGLDIPYMGWIACQSQHSYLAAEAIEAILAQQIAKREPLLTIPLYEILDTVKGAHSVFLESIHANVRHRLHYPETTHAHYIRSQERRYQPFGVTGAFETIDLDSIFSQWPECLYWMETWEPLYLFPEGRNPEAIKLQRLPLHKLRRPGCRAPLMKRGGP